MEGEAQPGHVKSKDLTSGLRQWRPTSNLVHQSRSVLVVTIMPVSWLITTDENFPPNKHPRESVEQRLFESGLFDWWFVVICFIICALNNRFLIGTAFDLSIGWFSEATELSNLFVSKAWRPHHWVVHPRWVLIRLIHFEAFFPWSEIWNAESKPSTTIEHHTRPTLSYLRPSTVCQ